MPACGSPKLIAACHVLHHHLSQAIHLYVYIKDQITFMEDDPLPTRIIEYEIKYNDPSVIAILTVLCQILKLCLSTVLMFYLVSEIHVTLRTMKFVRTRKPKFSVSEYDL